LSVADEKAAIRLRMRAALRTLRADEHARFGRAASERLDRLSEFRDATTVLLFRSLGEEIDSTPLFDSAFARGQQVLAPRATGAELAFVVVTRRTRWRRGGFGVLEPEAGDPLPVADIPAGESVIVVPGLAFSERGERLGRGGGHYDRALADLNGRAVSIGLAFDVQVLERLPCEGHDVPVDVIVTEARELRRVR
jgi:5-formyltetrahydrofolate cyclo-ligase